MLERLYDVIKEYGAGHASVKDVCRTMMEEGAEHTEIFAKAYTQDDQTSLAVLERGEQVLPQLFTEVNLAFESIAKEPDHDDYSIMPLDLDLVMHAVIQGNFPDGVILNPENEAVVVTVEDMFRVLQDEDADEAADMTGETVNEAGKNVENSADSEKNVDSESVKLHNVEATLHREGRATEAITDLAFALMADAEEGKSIICVGCDAGDEMEFYPEYRGEKYYYQFCTGLDHAPKDTDLMSLPMDEFFDLVNEAEAGLLFNSGETEEFVLDAEMLPFLQMVLKLSAGQEAKKFSADSKQVKEAADMFTWE